MVSVVLFRSFGESISIVSTTQIFSVQIFSSDDFVEVFIFELSDKVLRGYFLTLGGFLRESQNPSLFGGNVTLKFESIHGIEDGGEACQSFSLVRFFIESHLGFFLVLLCILYGLFISYVQFMCHLFDISLILLFIQFWLFKHQVKGNQFFRVIMSESHGVYFVLLGILDSLFIGFQLFHGSFMNPLFVSRSHFFGESHVFFHGHGVGHIVFVCNFFISASSWIFKLLSIWFNGAKVFSSDYLFLVVNLMLLAD